MKSNGKDITELLAVNRRNFIKFAVGGAVGTGLSPLIWKMADDTAIFTPKFHMGSRSGNRGIYQNQISLHIMSRRVRDRG